MIDKKKLEVKIKFSYCANLIYLTFFIDPSIVTRITYIYNFNIVIENANCTF